MKYINLLGEEIDTDVELKKRRLINPMVTAQGKGPEGMKCKHCRFCYGKHYSKIYYKCEFRGDTNGPGTDHKVNWAACGKFQPKTL
jgi:hypothetical protein